MSRSPQETTLDTDMFGRRITFRYSETWVGYSLLSLRIVMAWIFLQAGLEKWADGGWGDPLHWSSQWFLENNVAEANPLYDLFMTFANYPTLVDPLVVFGQVLIGLALLFGLFVRLTAFFGGLQMLLFWTAAWEGGIAAGLPVAHGYVIDSSFVYLLLLFGLGAWGAGRIFGLDAKIERMDVVETNPWLRYLLG